MYHNIFQVSTEPFTSDRLVTAADVLYLANLPMTDVWPAKDHAYALQDFRILFETKGLGICDREKFILFTDAPAHYFGDQIKDFRKAALKLAYIPESDYLRDNGNVRNLMRELQSSYDPVLNIYVMVDDDEPITMDAFIRTAELDTAYYFGSVFDCRFSE